MKTFYRHILFFFVLLLLGLTKQAFACPYLGSSFTDSDGTWTVTNYCDATDAQARAHRDSLSLYSPFTYVAPPSNGFGAGTITAPAGTVFYGGYNYPAGSHQISVFWVGSSTASCSSQRAAASQQCGGDDKYDINEQTCVATCKNTVTCSSQRAAASQECGGDNKYSINEQTCSYTCNTCQDKRAVLSSECGGSAQYTIDESTCIGECKNCVSERAALRSQCVYDGHSLYAIDTSTCVGQCLPNLACVEEKARLSSECGGSDKYIINMHICQGECKNDCKEVARAACHDTYAGPSLQISGEMNIKWFGLDSDGVCRYECRCPNFDGNDPSSSFNYEICQFVPSPNKCDLKHIRENCGGGIESVNFETCDYTCRTCDSERKKCSLKCLPSSYILSGCGDIDPHGGTFYGKCQCISDNNGDSSGESTGSGVAPEGPDIDDSLPKTCAELRSQCSPACNWVCSDSPGGFAGVHRCDCSTPSSNPDPSNPDPSDPVPSANPSDSSDSNGWLKSIKEDTDTFVTRSNDLVGWMKSSKEDLDKQLALSSQQNDKLDSISANMKISVENQGVVNRNMGIYSRQQVEAISGVQAAVVGVNKNLDETNKGIGELNAGFRNVSIGTDNSGLVGLQSLGSGGEVTGTGYGSAPTDLPTDTSFGTFTPRDSDSRSLVQTKLSGLSIDASDPVCGLTFKLPRLTANWTWELIDFPVDFCPYESMLSAIGMLLVFAAALNELYKFS